MEALRLDADLGLVREFAQEGLEMLDQIEPALADLGSPAAEPSGDPEFVHQVFRAFHSMKGSAGFMNLGATQRLTHEAETLLDRVRSGKSALTGERIELLSQTCDLLRSILERGGAEGHDRFAQNDVETLVRELRAVTAQASAPAAPAAPAAQPTQSPAPPRLVAVPVSSPAPGPAEAEPRPAARSALEEARARLADASVPAPEPALQQARAALAEALHALEASCAAARLAELGRFAGRLALLAEARTGDGLGMIGGMLELFAEPLEEERPGVVPGLDALADLVEKALAEAGMAAAGIGSASQAQPCTEPPSAVPGAGAVASAAIPPRAPWPVPASGATPRGKPGAPAAAAAPPAGSVPRGSIRVDSERLDGLVDLVGELIIAQSMLARFGAPASAEAEGYEAATAQLSKITRDLQDLSMSLRMVPAVTVFQKMVRLVRDLAAKLGKDAELILQGQETEVDKTVIEQLSDPLVHMLRNALDHGLEPAEERIRAGKPPRGRILLQARQEGDEVRISVRDDGRGLIPERLLKKGIERGLVRGDGAGMSKEEIHRLIFEPGFSTVEAVTDLSGRGVGMDVVKRNVEKLKGRIDVASAPGQGTAITIRLPLTLAIIEGMRVRVGESQYAIPMAAIREAVRVAPDSITRTVEGQELALIRGDLFPVLRLHETHGIAPDHAEPWEGLLVLLEHQDRTFALLVDELLGHQQTVVKGLCAYLGAVPGVSGCSILGDGNVSLILDVGDLAGRALVGRLPGALPGALPG